MSWAWSTVRGAGTNRTESPLCPSRTGACRLHRARSATSTDLLAQGFEDRQLFPNRTEAIAAGVLKAREEKVTLIIYTRDGRVFRRQNFGNEPTASRYCSA
ncbi:DUF2188 domain-containing protein [Cupriavidus oxalaticus]|uniref:DUF2188 domain-containing protein n=1 Tax=Cupriavidus oxalaticus TaxID=96344 RepID=UPI003F737E1B